MRHLHKPGQHAGLTGAETVDRNPVRGLDVFRSRHAVARGSARDQADRSRHAAAADGSGACNRQVHGRPDRAAVVRRENHRTDADGLIPSRAAPQRQREASAPRSDVSHAEQECSHPE